MRYGLNLRKDDFNVIDHINLREKLNKDIEKYLKDGNKINPLEGCKRVPKPVRTISNNEKNVKVYKHTKDKNNVRVRSWCKRAVGRKLYLSEQLGGKMHLIESIIRGSNPVDEDLMVRIEIIMHKIELFEQGLIN